MSTPSSHGYSVSEASRSVTDSDASFVTGEENVNGVCTDAVAEGGANGMSECGESGAHAAIDEHLQLSIEPDMVDSTHSEQRLAQGLRLTSENSGERLRINEEHALNSSSNDSNVEENICNGERDTSDKCDSTSSAALTPRTEEDGYRISSDESPKEDDIISVSCEERSVDVPMGDEEHDVLSMHNERSSSLLPSFNRTDSGSNSCSTLSDADSVSRVYEEQTTRSSFISDTTSSLVAHSEMAPHASKAVSSPLNSLGEHPSRTDDSVAGVVGYAHQDRNAATGVDEECSVSPESGAECLDHQDVSTDNETNNIECVVREDEDISFSGSPDAYVGDTSSDRISNELKNAQNMLASTTGEVVILDENSEDDGENDCLINRTSETDDGAFFCNRPHGGDFVSSSPIRATRQPPNIDEIESHNLQRSTTMSSEFHASQLSVHDSISDEPEPVDSPGVVDENACSCIASAGSKQLGLSAEYLSREYPDRSAEETQLLRDLLAVPVVTALTVQSCADDDHVDLDKASVIANPASGEPHLECTPPGSRDGDDTLSLGSPTSTASPRDSPLDGGSPVAPPHTSPSAGDGEVRQPSGDAEQRSSHVESSKEAGQGTGFVYVASDFEPEPKRRDRAPSSSSTPPDHAVPDEDGAMALDEAYTDVKTPFIEGELASGQRSETEIDEEFDVSNQSGEKQYEYLSEQPAAKRRKKCACVTCFDLLSADNVQYVIDQASDCLLKDNYDDTVFTMTLSMPVSTGIREYGVYLYLSSTIPDYQAHLPWQRLPTIKDIWKQLTSAAVGRRVDKRADNGYHAELQVNVVLNYRGDRRETLVIEKLRRLSSQRGGDAHCSSGAVTRMMVDSVLTAYHQQQQQQQHQQQHQQQQLVPCPPLAPVHPASYTISCSRASLFLAGRYNKYSRHLSQTPWLVGGQRREGVASSVLEMLSQRIIQLTRASDVKFSSSGREDVDVRTLGDGRPFVLELLQPHVTRLTWHDLRSLQTHINSTHRYIHVRHLQIVNRESTQRLKQGEQHKTKTYTVLVRCIAPAAATVGDGGVQCALCGQNCVGAVCERRLARLRRLRNLVLWQQTPVRVLHRRPMARRRRLVHSITAVPLTNSLFKLYLSTQAGTYIKEFVHGDFGRTHPSLTSLLAADDATFDVIVSANDVTESANDVTESANGDIGSASDVTGSANEINGSANDVTGSTNDINGSANDVTGSANEMNGSANDVTGSANEMNGLANDVTRSANDVIYSSVPPTTQYDIVALDVESVQLDWPPAVSYERVDTHSVCPLSCGDICTANCGTIDADVVRSGVEAGADKAGIVAKRVCSDASDSLQQEEYNSCSDED